ncbi:unnamed protein product [Urochloa decumbens]|uniref:Riboflavin biosynthesis protein PYRD, chloroplastic n=1 Tax=Urochloa decumbens TaxID=240449 RepID=A0ABC8Y9P6_9POAL
MRLRGGKRGTSGEPAARPRGKGGGGARVNRYGLKGARPPLCSQLPTVPNPTKLSIPRRIALPRLGAPPMASSLVARPHLTPRPVRAATLASPSRARVAAWGRGGVAAGVRCHAQAAGDLDAHYMRRCVELARRAAGHTSPNPMVGCVIVRDGRVVGEGFHPKAGQPHAEVFALRDAGDLAENATAYVSLEPCNHYGRTPPCTEALINAKVKEVVVGMTDPNPIVASKGIEKLQGAGIDVRVGVEEALCLKLNEAYIHRMLTGKAFATLRATLSMNGIVTNQIGKGAEQSGGYYSQLMKEYDGVIISSDLAQMSNLPVSHEAGANQPQYIIIAQGEGSRLHIPSLSEEHASKAIVLADSPVTVEPAGVEVAVLREIDLDSILQLLAQRGLCSVLVDFREAGESFASLLNDFQEDKLVQKVVVEMLPVWLASEGRNNLAFGGSQSFALKNVEYREVNGSVLLEGYV